MIPVDSDSEEELTAVEKLKIPADINETSFQVQVPPPKPKVEQQLPPREEDQEIEQLPWSEWERDKKRTFIERFSTICRQSNNYSFTCLLCGKQLKGHFLTILVHISGVRVRGSNSAAGTVARSAPCPLTNNPEEGLKIRKEVLDIFELEDTIAGKKRSFLHMMSGGSAKKSSAPSLPAQSRYSCLLPNGYKDEVIRWLKEDCPTTDIGGFVVGDKEETAILYLKSPAVVAGVPFANAAFEYYDLEVQWEVDEGTHIDPSSNGKKLQCAVVRGTCRNILLAERIALNILSRASGVASAARKVAEIKTSNNWNGYVAGTRKTTPGFKNVEKYALVVGGAATHRLDLSQMVMLKDNHIWSSGSITNAVLLARGAGGFSIKIEVECQSVEEALEAAEAGADIVMLDNFTSDKIENAASQIKAKYPHVLVEASGGITMDSIGSFMTPSVDVISMGSLTQGYSCADFSLKISH